MEGILSTNLESRVELKKPNGDVYLQIERMSDNEYILAHWVGRQTLETVKEGGSYYAKMMEKLPCEKLLNSHEELIGPWDVANDWITQEWTPKVRALGLHYLAQVLAPGIYGQMSFHQLHERIDNHFEIYLFNDERSAKEWLLSLPNN
ncbi:hypothetical protein [Adhaeribacter aquaticus]|uniref:hypothetical protein n=1 Tax=Adhaeribacter aquaticus TaxID=299567 RepID=UPI0003F80B3B|nr:hypothetical protein [Adhaeribacter aquaticus]